MIYDPQCTHEDIKAGFNGIVDLMKNLDNPLIYLKTPFTFTILYKDPSFDTLRISEKIPYASQLDIALYSQNHPNDKETILFL